MFYGFLIDSAVYASRFNTLMSKKFLYLLYRHPGVEQIRRTGPPEAVWMDFLNVCGSADTV